MEQIIWNTLGYLAMPTIFVVGLAATAVATCVVLDLLNVEPVGGYQ
ncbi:MAG TPA: TIGR02808 family protein [Motiliproteus sp.]